MFVNLATGFVLPPYWLNHPVTVVKEHENYFGENAPEMGALYQCPMRIKWEDEVNFWTLPFDPVISISGGNNIVRSDVLKQDNSGSQRRGSIKEVWSQKDYEIQFAGIFIGKDENDIPMQDLERLRAYCEARKIIEVECDLLEVFNITKLAIETFEFGHTPGRENQQFSIKAYSDDDFSLLIE